MPIDIEEMIEKAFEQAHMRALDQVIQANAETLFMKAISNGSSFSKRIEQKIEVGLNRFLQEGIRWEKKKPGFKKP